MKRRDFLRTAVLAGALTQLPAFKVMASEIQTGGPTNVLVDNDETAAAIEALNLTPEQIEFMVQSESFGNPLLQPVAVPKVFLPFEEVTSYISPFLEQSFDVFIFANTASTGSQGEMIRPQYMKVLRRSYASAALFRRNSKGRVIGLNSEMDLFGDLPISTGATKGGCIRTFSGIFRFDREDMKRKYATSTEAPMSYQSYIDFVYQDGRDSGVAIHGTPSKFRKYLGVQPDSHGCMRSFPENAKKIRELLMSPAMLSENLPRFNNRSVLPSAELMAGNVPAQPGIKALMIIFQGYSNASQDA